jgi:hypothetical protein
MWVFALAFLAVDASAFLAPLHHASLRARSTNNLHAAADGGAENERRVATSSRRRALAAGWAGAIGAAAAVTRAPQLALAADKVEVDSVLPLGELIIPCDSKYSKIFAGKRCHTN